MIFKIIKNLSIILLIIFSFQPNNKADDIKDFEIEEMSIGDSLLDFFTENEIKSKISLYYKNNKFASFVLNNQPNFKTYNIVQLTFKPSDKKYKLHSIEGHIEFPNDMKNCYKKMDTIVNELSDIYKDNSEKRD